MDRSSATHFNDIADKYEVAAKSWQCVYDQAQRIIDPLIGGRTVLDIGNGGVFPYDVALARRVHVLDISCEMLMRGRRRSVDYVVADALDLAAVKDDCVDVVLYVLCIHHINGQSMAETLAMLKRLFAAAFRVLRPGGSIIVVEPMVRDCVCEVEKKCFPVMRRVLALRGVDMVFFHSSATLIDCLAGQFLIARGSIDVYPFKLQGCIDPLGGSLPGIIKIPVQLYPATFTLLHARKS